MAGSRLELIGTVFSRMNGLLRTSAIKYEDRPVWFDVYRVFPPKLEPHFDRQPVLPPGVPEEIPDIIYKEDVPRAAFYKKFGLNPGGIARNLTADKIEDASTSFVEKWNTAQSQHPNWTNQQIIDYVSQDFSFGYTSSSSSSAPRRAERMSSGSSVSSQVLSEESEFIESSPKEQLSDVPKRSTKRTIVTAETLLSMFKEAKLKSQQTKDEPDNSETGKKGS